MRYMRVRLEQPDWMRHPMQEFISETEAITYEEMVAWNLSREDVQFLLFYVEGDVDTYRERVAEVDQIRWFEVTPVDDRSFYSYACEEYTPSQTTFFEPFAELRLVVVPPVVFGGDGNPRMTIVGTADGLSTLVEDLRDVASVGVEIQQVGSFDRRHQRVTGRLTDRQYEALETATDLGYYGAPRDASLAAVADELDVAQGTASELLRSAEATLMNDLLGSN